MSEIKAYSKQEIIQLILHMNEIYEVARLVNVGMTHQLEVNEDHTDLVETNYSCYAVWNKHHRCENCVSARAYQTKGKMTKFEFVDKDVYYVVAKYVEVDGTPYMLELVTKIDDETLFGAYGKEDFVNTIIGYNETLYVDSLTHAYNRRYYDSQLIGLSRTKGVAMMDIDHFKGVNDTYGHDVGDLVLKTIINTVLANVKDNDSVIRYGGDEFLIMFEEADSATLPAKLEKIRQAVSEIVYKGYPELKSTVSLGGVTCNSCTAETVQAADANLYKAKQTRNTVVVGAA